jgi:hypothetical protein
VRQCPQNRVNVSVLRWFYHEPAAPRCPVPHDLAQHVADRAPVVAVLLRSRAHEVQFGGHRCPLVINHVGRVGLRGCISIPKAYQVHNSLLAARVATTVSIECREVGALPVARHVGQFR